MRFTLLLFLVCTYCTAILIAVYHTEIKNIQRISVQYGTPARSLEKEGLDKPLEFVLFHREIRTREGDENPAYKPGYKITEIDKARSSGLARAPQQARTTSAVVWKERGPGNVPGRTRALFNIPGASNSNWLAGAATGGIWKTTDGGATWREKNDNLTVLPIASFAADKNATRIYAGTGEFISTVSSAIGDGIFVSTDRGESWTQLPATKANSNFIIVTRIIVHPDNPQLVLATTVASSNAPTNRKTFVMRSTDGGTSWVSVLERNGAFEQIIANPKNFNEQYVSEKSVGVWKSVDAGVTWTLSNIGMNPNGRIELAVSPVNPNKVYASAQGTMSGAESDLYVSTNAGSTWSLVDLKHNDRTVDFLGLDPNTADSQGFYDNTILADPFNENVVYVGGINLFRVTVGNSAQSVTLYSLEEQSTQNFLQLINFGVAGANGRLDVGSHADNTNVEIRFGPGRSQKAHRFLVPQGAKSGVPATNYTYQDYVDVPFEVWDVTNNRQLMVSFRDQGRDNVFNLIEQNTNSTNATQHSREYLFINNETYNAAQPSTNITTNGGHEFKMMYNVWPVLAPGGQWPPTAAAVLQINVHTVPRYTAAVTVVSDAYNTYQGPNRVDQVNLDQGFHPDHHTMLPLIDNEDQKTYRLLVGNDGGVFVSNSSTTPGVLDKSWSFRGFGYNTGQFYGADKKPNEDVYIGGLQDNGTRISSNGQSANASSAYRFAIGGDGFEVLWNNADPSKLLGTIYNGLIYRSANGGTTWSQSTTGLNTGTNFPFVTKLANAKDFPDRVFTVSRQGVHVSNDFGQTWTLTPIPQKFVVTSVATLDVEVSRANFNVVWAGSGMSNTPGAERNIFLSRDGGKTFTATQNFATVTMGSITRLATHPTQPQTAYALFSFFGAPKILRTTDFGNSWQDISGFGAGNTSSNGFPDVAVYCLYVRPDNPDILWAGTEIGIIESEDNGLTWSLLEDFPKVAVWEMKGQDNQVVIATHGRGIWTATLDAPQSGYTIASEILAGGTHPNQNLALRFESLEEFDSVEVYINNTRIASIRDVGVSTVEVMVSNVTAGEKEVRLFSYSNGIATPSRAFLFTHLAVSAPRNQYSTVFTDLHDFAVKGFSLQQFPDAALGELRDLHTDHPYAANTTYTATLRHPITINNAPSNLHYADIALVEPGKGSVLVEATTNGLDWIPLLAPYDASANAVWQDTFTASKVGKRSMYAAKTIDLTSKFSAGEQVLFRWRMTTGAGTSAWGWSVDYISIQETPLEVSTLALAAKLQAFPNPTSGNLTLAFELRKPSALTLHLTDMLGRSVFTSTLGERHAGYYEEPLDLTSLTPGTYLLLLESGATTSVMKVVVRK